MSTTAKFAVHSITAVSEDRVNIMLSTIGGGPVMTNAAPMYVQQNINLTLTEAEATEGGFFPGKQFTMTLEPVTAPSA